MKWTVLVLYMLAACSASAPPVAEPEPLPTHGSETKADTKYETETKADPEPSEHRPEVAAKEPTAPARTIPGPDGFWCAEFRAKAKQTDPLGHCYRLERTCNIERRQGIKAGKDVSTCEKRDAAHCFLMTDNLHQLQHWRCYDSLDRCTVERGRYQRKHPKLQVSECGQSAQSDWSGSGRLRHS